MRNPLTGAGWPVLLLGSAILLAGCESVPPQASTPALETNFQATKPTDQLRTDDPEEQLRRFGDLATLVGAAYGTAEEFRISRYAWEVPGAVLVRETYTCKDLIGCTAPISYFEYTPEGQVERKFPYTTSTGANIWVLGSIGEVLPDGSLLFTHVEFGTRKPETPPWIEKLKLDAQTGVVHSVYTKGERTVAFTDHRISDAAFAESRQAWAEGRASTLAQQAEIRRKEEEEDREYQRSQPNIAAVFASTFASEMNNASVQRSQAQAGINAALAQGRQQHQAQQRAAGQGMPAQAPARTPATIPASQVASASTSVAPSGASPAHATSSGATLAATPPRPERGEPPKAQLAAYPEAITVCTHPTGPNGNFTCSTPLTNRISGHLKDVSGQRTPDEFVTVGYRESCPDPRKLPSTTHLVWGCGFGATGNSNSMDRSAGVDVRERLTYYCSEKQTSCRRTDP